MRLECPNCGAQYEVPIGVIPEDGRDVQCSNCGHTWFEPHPDAVRAATAAAPPPPPPAPEPAFDDQLPDPAPEPSARPVDPAVADVLRQEAEYEARARAAESAGGLESQPDLGLDDLPDADDDSARRAREAQERMEARRGAAAPQPDVEDAVAATIAAAAAAGPEDRPRRDQLPDIEDINATLRSSKEPRLTDRAEPPPHMVAEEARRRSFRRGFMLMVLIAVILVALYIFAPRIAEAVPQLKAPLDQYVALVNQGRVWLDAQVAKGLVWLDSMASEASPPVTEAGSESPSQDQ